MTTRETIIAVGMAICFALMMVFAVLVREASGQDLMTTYLDNGCLLGYFTGLEPGWCCRPEEKRTCHRQWDNHFYSGEYFDEVFKNGDGETLVKANQEFFSPLKAMSITIVDGTETLVEISMNDASVKFYGKGKITIQSSKAARVFWDSVMNVGGEMIKDTKRECLRDIRKCVEDVK